MSKNNIQQIEIDSEDKPIILITGEDIRSNNDKYFIVAYPLSYDEDRPCRGMEESDAGYLPIKTKIARIPRKQKNKTE